MKYNVSYTLASANANPQEQRERSERTRSTTVGVRYHDYVIL